METSLSEQIKRVAEVRQSAKILSDAKKAALEKWENENRELLDAIVDSIARVAEEEAKLRELTLQAYRETGEKAPAPGVSGNVLNICANNFNMPRYQSTVRLERFFASSDFKNNCNNSSVDNPVFSLRL